MRGGLFIAAVFVLIIGESGRAQVVLPNNFIDERIAGGLDQPNEFAFLPDGRLLFVEQRTARIRMLVHGALASSDPVATVPEVEASGNEQGLLGLAVDPAWPVRPFVYVFYDHAGTSTIQLTRYTASGDLANGSSGNLTIDTALPFHLLTDIPDNNPHHNGGTLRFGPDGMLFASLGEDHNQCASQDVSELKGKILRLDVSRLPASGSNPPPKSDLVPPGNPFGGPTDNARLVWAYGLRNPFRFHVDRETGNLFVADVGAMRYEEINQVSAPGQNFGWPFREGTVPISPVGCTEPPNALLVPPIASYAHFPTLTSVISAGVYHAADYPFDSSFPPAYEGDYFFADYYNAFLRRLQFDGSAWVPAPVEPGQPNATDWATGLQAPVDFLVGPDGALWYVSQFDHSAPRTGSIRRIRYDYVSAVGSLAGTVNAGAGAITDVLRINGSSGDARRTVSIRPGEGFALSMDSPPSLASAAFALYVWEGTPSPSSVRRLPRGIGLLSFGICVHGLTPLRTFNNLGSDAQLCPSNAPSAPAPWSRVVPARAVTAPRTFTLQGIIQDAASASSAGASVTNAILLRFR